jgi:MOSC domain-containing protein YiiM
MTDMARILSINVGQPAEQEWAGKLRRTAIKKHEVSGPVRVEQLGIDGDQVADLKHHGGVHQAVYAFAREDLDRWAERLGRPIPNGQFGENLTTQGIDVNDALVGERWQVGTAVFEVAEVRIPCNVFKGWMGVSGFDNAAWVKKFTAEARPGPYLRVVQPGVISPGNELDVIHKPDHDVSVSTMFRALTTDRHLMPRLLAVGDSLAPEVRVAAEHYATVG